LEGLQNFERGFETLETPLGTPLLPLDDFPRKFCKHLSPEHVELNVFPQHNIKYTNCGTSLSRRWDVGIWSGLGWPRIETGGGRL